MAVYGQPGSFQSQSDHIHVKIAQVVVICDPDHKSGSRLPLSCVRTESTLT